MQFPKTLALALAVSAALAGCNGSVANGEANSGSGGSASTGKYTIDQSKLPPMNSFKVDDLDTTKNACEDFAGYANSKFLAANPVPGDRTSWGAFEMLDERSQAIQKQLAEQAAANKSAAGVDKIVGDLYATGMDQAAINAAGFTPIKADLDAISALNSKEAIVGYLRSAARKGDNFLFGFGPEADFKDPGNNIAYASQGGLGLPDKTYYTDAKKKDKLEAYRAHVANVLKLIGVPAADAAKQADEVIAFETRLAKASFSSEELSRDTELYYNPVDLAAADKLTPNFSWSEWFKSQGVAAPAKFSLAMPKFHQEVSAMLADVPATTWQSYLKYHTADSASPYLSDAFVQENFNFYSKTLRGQAEMKERSKRVLDSIENGAGEAFGQMYVGVAFSPESKARMEALVKNLGTALKARIEKLEWMSPETKAKAIEKWSSFTPKIGYPDKWRSWEGLKTGRDGYYNNLQAVQQFNYNWALGKIGKPVDRSEWGMPPQMVNAYYNPLMNEIVFPAAILQPPFFDPKADDAANYGGIGAVIGHEMIHGYDDQGSRFDATGKFSNWWTDQDAKQFASRTDKLVKQFDSYELLGEHVNGKLTLGENIADLGGLSTAYDAMKAATAGKPDPMIGGLTNDQRFFLNWATVWRRAMKDEEAKVRLTTDPHAPANFRAIGAPSNLPTFAAAFQCKTGQKMVNGDDTKVNIW